MTQKFQFSRQAKLSPNMTRKNKANHQSSNYLPFRSEIRASGAGEKWCHADDSDIKFQQFGWRCTNDENAYAEDVLIGNWNEKQFDLKRMVTLSKVPSHFNHYEKTYQILG